MIPTVKKSSINDRIIDSITNFIIMTEFSFFGEFSLFVNFKESKTIPTMGVYVNIKGMYCLYNQEFLDSLNNGQLNFVLLHELFHLLCDHVQRGYSLNHEKKLSNIAADMIINSAIREEYTQKQYDFMNTKILVEEPSGDTKAIFLPKEYNDTGLEKIYEVVYDWLCKKREQYDEWKQKNSQKQSQGSGDKDQKQSQGPGDKDQKQSQGSGDKDQNCPISKELRDLFDNLETYAFDEHLIDEIDPEIRKQIVDDCYNKLRQRGLVSSTMEKILERLKKSKKNYIEQIKKQITLMVGNFKYKTFLRPNRRGIEGLKGKRKKAKILNCILDTSGSMTGLIEKVLSFIFQDNIIVNLIQCDAEVKDFKVIKYKKELQKINILGFGGTILQPALDFIKSNRVLNVNNTVILTDGYCDDLDVSEMKKVLILTTNENVRIIGNSENVKQIIVDKDIE